MTTNRPYTAVRIEYVPAGISQLNMTAKKRFTIPGQNGGSVTVEAGGRFTVVRASSLGPDRWYIVRLVSGCKKCSCPATKPCKHERAVREQSERWPFLIVEPSYPQPATPAQLRTIAALDEQLGYPQRSVYGMGLYEAKMLIEGLEGRLADLERHGLLAGQKPEPPASEALSMVPERVPFDEQAPSKAEPCLPPQVAETKPTDQAVEEPKRLADHEPASNDQKCAIIRICKRNKLVIPCALDETLTAYAAAAYLKSLQKTPQLHQAAPLATRRGHMGFIATNSTELASSDEPRPWLNAALGDQARQALVWASLPSRQAIQA